MEPVSRNTAPAALIAALHASQTDPERLILLLPSDHFIQDVKRLHSAIFEGMAAAELGHIVIFGIEPSHPEIQYGYIEVEDAEANMKDVIRFVAKPSEELAATFLDRGNFYWNAGIFLFSAKVMIEAFEEFSPAILENCNTALSLAQHDLDFLRLDHDSYACSENISLDYAIIEKADNIKTVPLSSDWRDLGSWQAIWSLHEKDRNGNVERGDVLLLDTFNSFVSSEDDFQLSVIGLDNIFTVATRDGIVVASKDRVQDIEEIVNILPVQERSDTCPHRRVYRPWGWYEGLGLGDRYLVKCIMVNPGAKLSLQKHYHRTEHWVVVKGTLEVTVGDEINLLSENQSIYVPLGEPHRLVNPGLVPAFLIEVQSGSYLGEDDIVRFEDIYGR
ncbi:MAG: mannose-1-phosphate guanylyltransferase/mannose-6-phosphate isomerase, partial [Methyloligellaceae bacterium]